MNEDQIIKAIVDGMIKDEIKDTRMHGVSVGADYSLLILK